VPGQPVGLGKGIELNQGVAPIGIAEQVMRRRGAGIEIAVGFVDDES
jgi:hypothetical protein